MLEFVECDVVDERSSSSFLSFRRLSENLFVGGVGVPALSGPIRAGHVVRPGE